MVLSQRPPYFWLLLPESQNLQCPHLKPMHIIAVESSIHMLLCWVFTVHAYQTYQHAVSRGGIFLVQYTRCSLCRLIRLLSKWCREAAFFSASGAALPQEIPTVKWMSNQPALWTISSATDPTVSFITGWRQCCTSSRIPPSQPSYSWDSVSCSSIVSKLNKSTAHLSGLIMNV
jgi:hypothetical protein